MQEKNPMGCTENFHVESAALDMVRLRRARRMEAEFITSVLHPPVKTTGFAEVYIPEPRVVDPGLPALVDVNNARSLSDFQRYETAIGLRLFRALHELERLQRMRKGENLPAPAAVDVSVHIDRVMDADDHASNSAPIIEANVESYEQPSAAAEATAAVDAPESVRVVDHEPVRDGETGSRGDGTVPHHQGERGVTSS